MDSGGDVEFRGFRVEVEEVDFESLGVLEFELFDWRYWDGGFDVHGVGSSPEGILNLKIDSRFLEPEYTE